MLIKNGLVLNPTASNTLEDILDLRIENNRITQISTNLKPDSHETIIDATNLWVCPGFIDIHCHLRDLKQNVSEDILSGTTAAASGGYTTVVSMANTSPPIDNILALKDYKKLIAENALIPHRACFYRLNPAQEIGLHASHLRGEAFRLFASIEHELRIDLPGP